MDIVMNLPNNGFRYLCEKDVLQSNIFFTILQAQKDAVYNYFDLKKRIFLMEWDIINENIVIISKQSHVEESRYRKIIDDLRLLRSAVFSLHELLQTNLNDFKRALLEYEKRSNTNIYEEELECLLETHGFMEGEWTEELLDKLSEKLTLLEEKRSDDSMGIRISFKKWSLIPSKKKEPSKNKSSKRGTRLSLIFSRKESRSCPNLKA
ncbi:predicted protein [Chaetoceros tenuissimus]|uniref:Uncharacterized protein n=1 Tax=Chaetoceros tenuissimus TaxID=426638 RepID=A0AAD3DEP3_9STRA|nr:predicted protein [Chaetoceros tenuissimus]